MTQRKGEMKEKKIINGECKKIPRGTKDEEENCKEG